MPGADGVGCPVLALGAVSFVGRHICVPSHCWPHQQRPCASMRQVPVPQQRSSSCMVSVFCVDEIADLILAVSLWLGRFVGFRRCACVSTIQRSCGNTGRPVQTGLAMDTALRVAADSTCATSFVVARVPGPHADWVANGRTWRVATRGLFVQRCPTKDARFVPGARALQSPNGGCSKGLWCGKTRIRQR